MKNKIDNQMIDIHIPNIAKTFETIDLVSKQVQESLRIIESFGQTIQNSVKDIHYALETLKDPVDIFEKYNKYWQNFQQQYEITEQEANSILRKYKWFMTPSLPFDFVHIVVEIGRKSGNQRANINKLFINHFTSNDFENLNTLVEEWNNISIFKPRMKIFKDCVSTLRDSKKITNPSNLVLPTLIAQIDGIQADFMELNGLSFDIKSRQWKDETGVQIHSKPWFEKQTSNHSSIYWSDQEMLNLCNHIFFDILFQKSNRGKSLDTPFTFSRHKIMHGEYINYG